MAQHFFNMGVVDSGRTTGWFLASDTVFIHIPPFTTSFCFQDTHAYVHPRELVSVIVRFQRLQETRNNSIPSTPCELNS